MFSGISKKVIFFSFLFINFLQPSKSAEFSKINNNNNNRNIKITLSNDFETNIKEFKFSNHSISKEDGPLTLRLKVPYNYFDLDEFELKAIELLGIDKNWVINMSLENSKCTNSLKK